MTLFNIPVDALQMMLFVVAGGYLLTSMIMHLLLAPAPRPAGYVVFGALIFVPVLYAGAQMSAVFAKYGEFSTGMWLLAAFAFGVAVAYALRVFSNATFDLIVWMQERKLKGVASE